MTGEQPSELPRLTGSRTHTVDPSHRFMLPMEWRPANPALIFTLIPWAPWGKDRILALAPSRWNQLVEKVRTFLLSDEDAVELERATLGVAQPVRMDKVGRICLGEELRRSLGIGDEIRLIGLGDRFEIWDAKRWEEKSRQPSRLGPETGIKLGL